MNRINLFLKIIATLTFLFLLNVSLWAQLSVNSCPTIDKRNNGNGLYSSSAGYFPNDPNNPKQNNPVAQNVNGTSYQTVTFIPSTKTGFYNFFWTSVTPITNFPVITRVWITADGSESPTLSNVKFGPPPPPDPVGQNYYVNYSFYGQNIPPVGKITLEFTDPQTGLPAFTCTFDLKTNSTAPTPTGFSCAPTILSQPSNQSLCGDATAATFSVSTLGAASWQWQVANVGSNTWTNVTGPNYSGATTRTLTISNPTLYDNKQYRVIATGTTAGCTTTSEAAVLVAKPLPTATFGLTNCTQDQQNVAITLTGTKPWTLTYNVGGGSSTTISNITASPYYLSMSGASTYTITSLSDAYCANSGTVAAFVLPTRPSITLSSSNLNMCVGGSSVSLAYSSTTNSPDKYTLTAGTRAMPGFSTLTNQSLSASPVTIQMPSSGVSAGVYDFNLTVTNSTTGCVSAVVPITVTVRSNPSLTASAGSGSTCKSTNFTLSAQPSNLSSYSWGVNPTSSGVGTGPSVTTQINATTTFLVTGTDSYGCAGTATVTVTAVDGPTLTITPSSPTICIGSATSLSVSGGNTYSWTENAGSPTTLSASTGDVVVASPTTTTTYTVSSANLTGCSSTGTVTVTVSDPAITVTSSATICAGTIKQLDGGGAGAGGSYYWYPSTGLYTDAGASVAYTGDSRATVYAKPESTTTYYLKGVTSSGCEKVISSTVTISPPPVDEANSTARNFIFCVANGNSVNLIVKLTSSVTSATWAYSLDGSSYTSFTSTQTDVGGTTIDLSFTNDGNTPPTHTLTVGGIGSQGLLTTDPNYFRLIIVGSSCTYNYDIKISDTKRSGDLPAPTATKNTICSGDITTLTAGTVAASASPMQWQSSTNNSTWNNITGANSSSYTTPSLTTNTYYRLDLGSGSCAITTSPILITVNSALAANTVSTSTICTSGAGSNPTLNGSAITSGVYQWQISSDNSSWSDILGATSEDYTLATNVLPSTTYYRRVASAGTCNPSNSSSVILYPPISNNQISTASSTSYCGTASAITLTGTTPTGGNSSYTYKWQASTTSAISSFSDIGSATSINYTTTTQSQTYWYKRIVTSNTGGCTDESSVIQVTVNPNPTVSVTPSATVCQGTSYTLTASGAQTYSWTSNVSPDGLSATNGTSVIATPASTATYTVTGTNAYSCTGTATTTLTITSLPSAPSLSSSATTICSNSSAISLSSYNNSAEWFSVPDPTLSAFSVTTASTAGTYYAYAKSGSCYSSTPSTFTLTVRDLSAPIVNATTVKLCSGTFDLRTLQSTAASGTTLQWWTGATYGSGTYVSDPSSVSSGTYYLYAVSSSPTCNSLASSAVTVSVSSLSTVSLTSNSASVCFPSTINLNSYYTPSGSNTYSWYSSNSPSPANSVLNPTSVNTSGTFYLFATNSDGCQGTPATFTTTVNSKPSVSLSASEDFCGTYSGIITATTDASGSPSYAWSYSTNNGTTWTDITSNTSPYSNYNTSALTITSLTVDPKGTYYRCIITGTGNCTTTSDPAIVITQDAPVITSCPSNTYMQQTTSSTFSVLYEGAADAIQWKYLTTTPGAQWTNVPASSPYSGTTSKVLQISGATLDMNGYQFKAVISNTCGSVECSSPFTLSVGTSLPVTWLSFTVQKQQSTALLNWSTATEVNTKDFEIQYSTNTTDWSPIGTVLAAGNSSTQRNYSYVHTSPLKNNNYNYYRILQRDLDGKFSYSKIVSILFNEPGSDFLLYPNPADKLVTIYLSDAAEVSLINSAGSVVWKSKLPAGRNQLPLEKFSSGVYVIRAGNTSQRLIIQ